MRKTQGRPSHGGPALTSALLALAARRIAKLMTILMIVNLGRRHWPAGGLPKGTFRRPSRYEARSRG
jgi:hypothetical protein